jgi:hypothetical protein
VEDRFGGRDVVAADGVMCSLISGDSRRMSSSLIWWPFGAELLDDPLGVGLPVVMEQERTLIWRRVCQGGRLKFRRELVAETV